MTSILDEDEGAISQPREKSPRKETKALCQRIDIWVDPRYGVDVVVISMSFSVGNLTQDFPFVPSVA